MTIQEPRRCKTRSVVTLSSNKFSFQAIKCFLNQSECNSGYLATEKGKARDMQQCDQNYTLYTRG